MARILLITYFFPPVNSAGSICAYSLAKCLKKMGHNVTVLTTDSGEEKEKNYDADLSFFEVHKVSFFDIRSFMRKVFNIKYSLNENLGSGDANKFKGLFVDKMLSIYNSFFHERGILFGAARFPSFADLWFFNACKEAEDIINKEKIDVIITKSIPNVAHLIGVILKKKFKRILWVTHFEDLWTQNPWTKGCFPFTIFEEFFERKCINKADIITTVSEVWMQWLKDKYPYKHSSIFCIENGFDDDLIEDMHPSNMLISKVKKTIVFTGTLYEKRGDVEPLFKVINHNYSYYKDKIGIVFYGGIMTRNILIKFLNRYPDTKTMIEYGGFLSKKETFEKQNNADILFFVEKDTNNDGMLTSKIYEYIMFKKPILCMGVTPFTYIGNFLKNTGLCIFCGNDIMKIEESLKLIIEGKVRISPNEGYINNLSRRIQVEKLDKIIKENLNK